MVNGDIKIFSGMANNPLAAEIADLLGTGLGDVSIQEAPDSETLVMVNESVRGCDVYVVQPTSAPVNDNLMQLLLVVDSALPRLCQAHYCGHTLLWIFPPGTDGPWA